MKAFCFSVCILAFISARGQLNFSWQWDQTADFTDEVFFLKQPLSGNYIAGYEELNHHGLIFTVNQSGNAINQLEDSVSGSAVSLKAGICNSNDNLFLLSTINHDSSRLVSYNQMFQFNWEQRFHNELAVGLEFDSNHNLIMLCDSDKVILRKISPNGNILWTVTNDSAAGTGHLIVTALKLDNANNIYVLTQKKSFGDYEYCLKKFSPNGVFLWQVIYDPSIYRDIPHDMCIDDSCNIYVTGESWLTSNGYQRAYASLKVDSVGTIIWSHTFSSYSSIGSQIRADIYGNAYVAGVNIESNFDNTIRIFKYGPGGDSIWCYTADTAHFTGFLLASALKFAFEVSDWGECYLGYRFQIYNYDDLLIEKITPGGSLLDSLRFFTANWNPRHFILESNRVAFEGYYYEEENHPVPPNAVVMAFDNPVGIESNGSGENAFVFPNPFSDHMVIDLPNEVDGTSCKIILLDMDGKEIPAITRKDYGTITLVRGDLISGIYFCIIRSENGEFITKSKVIVE